MSDPMSQGPAFSPGILSWLKIISFCVTSLLALLGLLFEFKDKRTHRLTPWGRVNLCGLIVAFCVGIVSQVKEDMDKHKADEENKTQLTAIATSSETAVTKATAELAQLSKVIDNNEKLITKTQSTLDTAQEADKKIGVTIHDAERQLQPMGDSLQVNYEVTRALSHGDKSWFRDLINNFIDVDAKVRGLKKPTVKPDGYDEPCDLKTDNEVMLNSLTFCTVLFGLKSKLATSDQMLSLAFAKRVPIEFTAYSSRPPKNMQEQAIWDKQKKFLTARLASYQYDPRQDTEPNFYASNGTLGRPAMVYREGQNFFVIDSGGYVRFDQSYVFSPVVSALDFAGNYLTISNKIYSVNFCILTLKLGSQTFRIPLQKLEKDYLGDYVYRFPHNLKQSEEDYVAAISYQHQCSDGPPDAPAKQ